MSTLDAPQIVMVLVCAGALIFLLSMLYALVKEELKLRRTRRIEGLRLKAHLRRRREKLIVNDVETLKRRLASRSGEHL
jgi:hypothetical protein